MDPYVGPFNSEYKLLNIVMMVIDGKENYPI